MNFTHFSKVAAPVLPSTVLHRASLLLQLHNIIAAKQFSAEESVARYKLVLLCAPAGYGKTTLLADFVQSTPIPCCWFFLDQSDTDRFTFLHRLLASIRHRFPGFGAALDPLLLDGVHAIGYTEVSHRVETFVDALITTLEKEVTEQVVFLLCNYHEVDESPTITTLVNQILQKLPARCILIIESRSTPSIELASLLAHRQVVGWGKNKLRMTAREILELAHIQGVAPLSEAEAEQLALAFDGWIAGILLGTRLGDAELLHTGTRTGILQGLPFMRVERQKLFAYLVDEIFKREPVVYTFLKEAAIFRQMVPALCDALLDITNASEHLEHLARQGMFVSCNDDGPQPIYTCHPVLRELLCDELRRQAPERFTELHRRAAELSEAAQSYDEAIFHTLLAGETDLAIKLIIQAHEQMSTKGYTETLLRWIDALPPSAVESHPPLLLICASIALVKGEHAQAVLLLDTASSILANPLTIMNADDLPRLQAEIMVLRSKAFFLVGAYQEAQLLCRQVLDITSIDEVILRADAHARLGICAELLGDLASSIEHLQKALLLWGRTVRHQAADVHSALANAYNMLGNFALAEHHILRAIDCYDQLHDEKGKAIHLAQLGVYKQRQGAFDEAEAVLTQALTITQKRTPSFEREEACALVNLGSVYQDQARYELSLKTLENGLELARQVNDNPLINCSLCYLAMTYLLMGDASTAMVLISETNLPPPDGGSISDERATYDLTYGTILLHQSRYDDANACFTALENSLSRPGLNRERLQLKVRMAACQLARMEKAEAGHHLEEVAAILERQGGYEELVFTWLSHFPEVYQLVKTLPALERLRALLHIAAPVPETNQVAAAIPPALSTPAPPLVVTQQTALKIQAFGEPTVFLDGRSVIHWRMARSMELFFFLLDCGRPIRKEQIITALWPRADDQINQTFHSTVYYLRKALNESYIVSGGGSYSLNLPSADDKKVQYDVTLFKEHYAQAKHFLASEDNERAKAAFLAMVQLYQGDYVHPFYGDWCTFRRAELRSIYLEARNHLAHIAWQQEAFDESAVHWQHILAMDNCLEEAHYGLIKYYMRKGERSLALRQYRRCVETLQQELATPPGSAIQSLYQRLISPPDQLKKNTRASMLSKNASHNN